MGLPQIGSITLGVVVPIRLPKPAASITAFSITKIPPAEIYPDYSSIKAPFNPFPKKKARTIFAR